MVRIVLCRRMIDQVLGEAHRKAKRRGEDVAKERKEGRR